MNYSLKEAEAVKYLNIDGLKRFTSNLLGKISVGECFRAVAEQDSLYVRGSTPARLKQLYGNVNTFKRVWEVDDVTETQVREIARKEANDMVYKYRDKVYNKISEIPEWGKPTVEKLYNKGLLKGTDKGLEISDTLLRVFVINDRADLYS